MTIKLYRYPKSKTLKVPLIYGKIGASVHKIKYLVSKYRNKTKKENTF